ncbi:MAG TPA: sigma-70 family RNA polymerase sigma factor [Candidatus Acidoferrales bacterium]|nr:sigma-70 family RNA polymerase sigma factor [Candidatus Acidoferrales bacterium]
MALQPRENLAGNAAPGGINCAPAAARLYVRAGAGWWNLSVESFGRALERSATKRFAGAHPDPETLNRYLESLELEDLALACACAEGNETAWNKFVSRYREELYAAAHAIARKGDDAAARELADSLFGELYGVPRGQQNPLQPGAVRRPLLDYFHGRSRLSTWLRAVLSQRYVDRLRESSRFEPLEEDRSNSHPSMRRRAANDPDPERAEYRERAHAALEEALAEVPAKDRLAIALYYSKGNTLAMSGEILGEHEATVSRRLERARRSLRDSVENKLRAAGLDEAQVARCFECALDDGSFNLDRALPGSDGHRPAHSGERAARSMDAPRPAARQET